MHGVSIHGLWVGAVFEPIVGVVNLVTESGIEGSEE
jgi:hypothetical protein